MTAQISVGPRGSRFRAEDGLRSGGRVLRLWALACEQLPELLLCEDGGVQVCSAISGQTVACLSPDDVEGKSAREVKRLLAVKIGVPRFRQRLFVEDDSREILDDEILTAFAEKVRLVLLEFEQGKGEADPEVIAAAQANESTALERLLQLPSDPNLKDLEGWTPLHFAAEN
eukprot:Skav214669  [mRNA]  locus=scaffold923:286032:287432:+ [translate_table: standard]